MKIRYKEESDYGQDILELIGMCVSLQDPEKEYTLKELHEALAHIRGRCNRIEMCVADRMRREKYLGME